MRCAVLKAHLIRMSALAVLLLSTGLAACQAAPDEPLLSKKSAVELRAIQSRAFDTADREAVLRAMIATLQDLGYSLDKVEASAGTVTATKLARLKMTTASYPHGTTQTVVRANAIVAIGPQKHQVDDAEFYRVDFFEPFSRTMNLQAMSAPDLPGMAARSVSQSTTGPAMSTETPRS
jgi:hypothetical protein